MKMIEDVSEEYRELAEWVEKQLPVSDTWYVSYDEEAMRMTFSGIEHTVYVYLAYSPESGNEWIDRIVVM